MIKQPGPGHDHPQTIAINYLIGALGGRAVVSELMDIRNDTVRNWQRGRSFISPQVSAALIATAEEVLVELTEALAKYKAVPKITLEDSRKEIS